MPEIPLIRACQLTPFVTAIERMGNSIECSLRNAGLGAALLSQPAVPIPEVRLWQLASLASHQGEHPGFGFLVGECGALDQLGSYGARVCASPTLLDALQTFIAEMSTHHTAPPFWTELDGDQLWLCRQGPGGMPVGHWQIEQYVVSVMIELVRLSAGPHWTPREVRMQAEQIPGVRQAACLRGTRLFAGQRHTAICLPRRLLSAPMHFALGGLDKAAPRLTEFSPCTPENLIAAIAPIIETKRVTLPIAAEYLGVSVRSLQRQLQQQGFSFSGILNQARLAKAITELKQEHRSISAIAKRIGYSDTAHFTRAFKNWTGLTPHAFRQHDAPNAGNGTSAARIQCPYPTSNPVPPTGSLDRKKGRDG